MQIDHLWQRMFHASDHYGRRGAAIHVISAIDIALWDIAGKVAGRPVCELLGGRRLGEIPVYASEVMPDTPDDVRRIAGRAVEAGYAALKLGWGPLGRDLAYDEELVRVARETLGPDRALMIDGGRAYTVQRALELLRRVEEQRLYWFEEALQPDDLAGYRRLAARAEVRIAAGEADETLAPFRALVEEAQLDVLQPDIARCGGFTVARQIALLERSSAIEIVPHCFSTGILVAASLHFVATLDRPTWSEYSVADSPLVNGILHEPFVLERGCLAVPGWAGSRCRARPECDRPPQSGLSGRRLMAAIEFRGVTKRFPDGTIAVDDLHLRIEDGEFMIFVGPSGCGKTTALRMVAGLEQPTSGEILVGDMVVNDLDPVDRDIAMVFQNYALYPHMTVRANIGFPLETQRMPKPEREQRIAEAAALLGLEDLLDRKPRALSGGQRQRVAMGRAIVRHPQSFLMDEPLSNLDAKLRVQMRAELAKLHQRLGVTTLYVTHDQVEAMTLGQRVAVLDHGVVQQVDAPEVLYNRPANTFVASFIGSPSMNFLRARSDGRAIVFGGFTLPLPETVATRLRRAGGRRARRTAARALLGRPHRGRGRRDPGHRRDHRAARLRDPRLLSRRRCQRRIDR